MNFNRTKKAEKYQLVNVMLRISKNSHKNERLSKTGKVRPVFNEIRDQIMAKRIRIKKGTMQGASFIDADRGEYGRPRGNDATRRSRDGRSAAKNHGKHYGYKQQTLTNEIRIIEKLFVTPANVHDSMIDLSIPGIFLLQGQRILRI